MAMFSFVFMCYSLKNEITSIATFLKLGQSMHLDTNSSAIVSLDKVLDQSKKEITEASRKRISDIERFTSIAVESGSRIRTRCRKKSS